MVIQRFPGETSNFNTMVIRRFPEETSSFNTMVIPRFPVAAYAFFPGAAQQQQSILTYQMYIQDGIYGNETQRLQTPNSNLPQVPVSPAKHHQSAVADDNGDSHHPGGATGLPNTEKYGNPHSHGNSDIHEHNRYRNGLDYHHIPSRMNYGYKKRFWRVKSLNDE